MTAILITFGILLACLALAIWVTRDGGTHDPNDMWGD